MFVDGVSNIGKAGPSNSTNTTQEVLRKLRVIAEEGNDVAAEMMGVIYYKGLGVARSYPSAFEWYKKSADEGNIDAMRSMGILYENGRGVDKSEVKGFRRTM